MCEEVTKWLEKLGLDKYVDVFVENDVDLHTLPELNEDDLKELGLSLGHRRALQKAIASLTEDGQALSDLPSIPSPKSESDTSLAAWERHPGERKPVTMLFADITGSTALTEKLDAEEAHDILYGAIQPMCEAVGNYRGTVCKLMGDGIMAMFGAPMASEHHAVDACEAALEMQNAIGDYANGIKAGDASGLRIRVGLHSGEVVVLTVGEGDKVRVRRLGTNGADSGTNGAGSGTRRGLHHWGHPLAGRESNCSGHARTHYGEGYLRICPGLCVTPGTPGRGGHSR